MEVLLLSDISGVGRKNDLVVVKSGFALNHLLPERKALVVTPNVRRRYAEGIKRRALEREQERELLMSLSAALQNKTVHISAKAGKGGKLYAAISEQQISDTLKNEYALDIPASAIEITKQIKSVGPHQVTVSIGTQKSSIPVEVKAAAEAKA
jgi:large subunit ribosomal protein L9